MRLRALPALLLLALAVAFVGGAWVLLTPTASLREGSRTVEIPAHDRITAIAGRLHQAGIVSSPTGFIALSVVRGSFRRLKAGEYEVPRGASTLAVLRQLEAGRVRQHTVLHPEGATVAELGRLLESERLASAADTERAARDPAFLHTVGIDAPSVEGYLFPDTYQFVRGMTAQQILARMVQRLHAKLGADIEARAERRHLTLHQLLTLASIVEREAVVREERPLIAAVFLNRLGRGMPLQADPTVQYAVGKERQTLTRADLTTDHPYNTYRRTGLPPGPIASAGLDAIRAVLDPAPVPYLYFVAIDDHRHHFSTTVEEHNHFVARYRLARTR